MKQRVEMNLKEMQALSDVVPMKVLLDNRLLTTYVREHDLSNMQLAQILTYTALRLPAYKQLSFDTDKDLTFGELFEYYERARLNFIIIHRVNFLVHQSMIAVYDLLDKEKRLRFRAKERSKDAEKTWRAYEEPRRKEMNADNWFALQDHFVVVEDMLTDYTEKVYATLRDRMIQLHWSDIEVKARIELALLMVKCARHSFVGFMQEFREACGADFTSCFAAADMTAMATCFVRMVKVLGIKVERDKHGLYDVEGIGFDKCPRITWAWNDFIKALRDDELMDAAALKAFSWNPTVEAQYQQELEKENRREQDTAAARLSEKFKVTRQSP